MFGAEKCMISNTPPSLFENLPLVPDIWPLVPTHSDSRTPPLLWVFCSSSSVSGTRFLLLLAQLNLPVFPQSFHVFTLALLCSVSSAFPCVPVPLAHSPASYYFINLELQTCTSGIHLIMGTNYKILKNSSVVSLDISELWITIIKSLIIPFKVVKCKTKKPSFLNIVWL